MKQALRIANIKRKIFLSKIAGKENKFYFNKFINYDERLSFKKISRTIEPWAFIRISNEESTLEMSLESAAKAFSKGVIAYNSCTDKSPEIIKNFCTEHPDFFYVEYPFDIVPANSQLLKDKANDIPYRNTLAAYYNFVLSFIPKGDWLCKIDGDHFHFSEVFNFGISRIQSSHDFIWFPRVDCYIDKSTNPPTPYGVKRHVGSDQWLVQNTDLYFENVSFTDNNGFHAYETLRWKSPRIVTSTECASIHFPYEKKRRSQSIPKQMTPWEDFSKELPYGFLNPKYSKKEAIEDIFAKIKR